MKFIHSVVFLLLVLFTVQGQSLQCIRCTDCETVPDDVDIEDCPYMFTTTPDGVDTTTPNGADTTSPDGADTTTSDGADTTTPNNADTTSPDGADTTTPDGAGTTTPNGADTTSPNGADTTSPDGTDTTLPDNADTTTDATDPENVDNLQVLDDSEDQYRCYKLTILKANDDSKQVNRGCTKLIENDDEKTCKKIATKHEDCRICDTDKCNSSSQILVSIFTIIIGMFLVFQLN